MREIDFHLHRLFSSGINHAKVDEVVLQNNLKYL